MTTVVTGFGPFEAWRENTSELVVRRVAALALPDVITEVLPVSYRRAAASIQALLEAHRPSMLLMLGLAGSAAHVRLEQVARNRDEAARPDADGVVRAGASIVPNAPDTHASTLPLAAMARVAEELGVAVEYSNDAGGYVCNHTFFHAQHLTAARFPACRSGFVHLPNLAQDHEALERVAVLLRRWHERSISGERWC